MGTLEEALASFPGPLAFRDLLFSPPTRGPGDEAKEAPPTVPTFCWILTNPMNRVVQA